MRSSSSDASDSEGVQLLDMQQYQNDVIQDIEEQKTTEEKPDPEEIKKKIELLEKRLDRYKIDGAVKLARKTEAEIDTLKLQLLIPDQVSVDLQRTTDAETSDYNLPKMDLSNFWHYKVLNTPFTGDDSINLTNDDSDISIYETRKAFIDKFCDKSDSYHDLGQGLKVPTPIWASLFPHQRVAVEWLWGLHLKGAGGIEGDEMGLGKTAIVCVFLGALAENLIIDRPILVICPLTVTQQWIRELHIWCPQVRSVLLHSTRSNKEISDVDLLREIENTTSVVVTNYESLHKELDGTTLQMVDWSCIICDEGHRIRNHESKISRMVKKLIADFRLAVSGSPIQNNLIELWSLFDFAYPGLLGALDVFEREFAEPIQSGSYANSKPAVVYRAYTAAMELRDMIKPYLIRRLKSDVKANLPAKTEQIFFCGLTPAQTNAYKKFLHSNICRDIIAGRGEMFVGIDILRKICNHPALDTGSHSSDALEHSSKLVLLKKILPQWHARGHRVILFSQYLKMLDFIVALFDELGLDYFRIDGATSIGSRQSTIDKFNAGEKFGCILSTKVGGVGVNLIGADRVIIVDPDWNPSTDNQALERSWRIGQTKPVSVFRLICQGTIEEKMYKKQIFKQYLSNKIMQGPSQKRLFAPQTVLDLFRLGNKMDKEIEKAEEEAISTEIEEQESDVADGGDAELMKSLVEGGNIERVFNHSNIFVEGSAFDQAVAKNEARTATKRGRMMLAQSVSHSALGIDTKGPKISAAQLISRVRSSESAEVSDDLTSRLIHMMKERGGICQTSEILSRFGDDRDVKRNPEAFRQILRRIAVYNKRTRNWYLIPRFKH